MPDPASAPAPYTGEQLWLLTEEIRLRMFKAALFLSALLVLPGVLMIVAVGEQLSLRLALLAVIGALCALGASEAPWCRDRLREQQWLVLLPAAFAATVLAIGGARQNATFIVIAAAFVGTPALVPLAPAMAAGAIVAIGYATSIVVRHQGLLVDGSAGDVAALLSLLVAIYGAHRAAELVARIVGDVNRDASEAAAQPAGAAPAPAAGRHAHAERPDDRTALVQRVIAGEAAGRPSDDALRRLSRAQRPVAYLAGDGLAPKQIAERLGKSTKTVSNQLRSINDKLEVRTRAQLAGEIQRLLARPARDDARARDSAPPREPPA